MSSEEPFTRRTLVLRAASSYWVRKCRRASLAAAKRPGGGLVRGFRLPSSRWRPPLLGSIQRLESALCRAPNVGVGVREYDFEASARAGAIAGFEQQPAENGRRLSSPRRSRTASDEAL